MANVGIVGWGVVGQASGNGFLKNSKNKVFWFDKFKKESITLEKVIKKSEFIFVCVPTPMFSDDSGIDLSIINEVVDSIAPAIKGTEKVLIIKSTVVPGTTVSLAKKYPKVHFAMNPEFITEANAFADFLNPDRTVIGVLEASVGERISLLYQNLYGEGAIIFITDPTTAEMVKYMANTMLATQVIFANEMFDLAEKLGIRYEEVEKMVRADKRMEKAFLSVTTERGFGQKCFPKDTVALLGLSRELGVELSVLGSVWKKNLKIRKVRDWEEINGAVRKKDI